MSVNLDNGMLSISLYDILASLPGTARADLIDTLACREEVIDEVMNQVIDGYTSMESHGPRSFGTSVTPTSGIDLARRRIAEASSKIAAKEIENLVAKVKREQDSATAAWQRVHELESRIRRYE